MIKTSFKDVIRLNKLVTELNNKLLRIILHFHQKVLYPVGMLHPV